MSGALWGVVSIHGVALDIPVLQTERLILRGFRAEDFDAFAKIWADPVVTQNVGVPARNRVESWQSYLKNAGNWMLLGYGQWAICDRGNDAVWGQTGFFNVIRGHGPAFDDYPEAGWVLAQEAMGRGLGSEATRAAHDWFDAQVGGPTVAQVAPANKASRALAARLGYVEFDEVGPEDNRVILHRRG